MKTKIAMYGIILLLLAGFTAAMNCTLTTVASEYVTDHNLTVPTTEWGCKIMNNKFVANDKQCWVLRERDGRTFKGVMGVFKDGSEKCFIPGRPRVAPLVVAEPVCTTSCSNNTEEMHPVFCLKTCTQWQWHPLRCIGTWEWNYDYCENIGLSCQPGFDMECTRYLPHHPDVCIGYTCIKTESTCTKTCS